jgi:hypothetical protein
MLKVRQSRYRPGVAQRVPGRLSRSQGHSAIRRIYVNEKFQ